MSQGRLDLTTGVGCVGCEGKYMNMQKRKKKEKDNLHAREKADRQTQIFTICLKSFKIYYNMNTKILETFNNNRLVAS